MVLMDIRVLLNGPLKLRHLVLILTIAEHGSIMGAAKHLYITQPVVSRGLREAEDVLGAPLFERGPRGVRPTDFAEVFIDHARAIVGHVQQATQHISEIADATVGSVVVGTYVAGANLLLPRAIASLKRQRPKLNVQVREATPDRLTNGLIAGDIDVVVGRLSPLKENSPLQQAALYHEPFQVIARPDHPIFSVDGELGLADLCEYPWVLPATATTLRGELEQAFTKEHLELPEQQVECSSPITLRALVAETDYLALQPYTLANADAALKIVDLRIDGIGQTVGVTMLLEKYRSPAVVLMLKCLEIAATDIRNSMNSRTYTGVRGAAK